ncbi:MAG TPA: hypothetical protein VN702_15080 [Acetobacteraceae bacterium]|nr:hypothetical protein [Acetobacteraceae bacterium]
MSRFFGKLAFIHRRLWQRDGLYSASLLLGPAPIFGCAAAAALWLALHGGKHPPPAWAVPHGSIVSGAPDGEPKTVQPSRPLPALEADGTLAGYEAGWVATTHPIAVSATLDVDVKRTALTAFPLDGASFDMGQIIKGGLAGSLYVGEGAGFLAVRMAGVYALSARIERPAGPRADCLIRLGFGSGRIVSNLELAVVRDLARSFDAARFDLQPGLYRIGWAFGCWHDQTVVGPGRMTLLVGHPGDRTLLPARPDDIVRPKRISSR